MYAPKRLARLAGVLYLLNGLVSTFALLFVDKTVYVPGDAARTVRNLIANAGLVRFGIVANLFQATEWLFLAMTLYLLLKHVHQSAASAMVVLVAIGTSITCLNEIFEFEGLRVATGKVGSLAFGGVSSNALALLLLDTQHNGILIAQIFFGLWLVPLGYLAYTSGWFPKALGVLLVVGGGCYLVDLVALFLVPDLSQTVNSLIVMPSALAEISMVVYLLVFGVRTQDPGGHRATVLPPGATLVERSVQPA